MRPTARFYYIVILLGLVAALGVLVFVYLDVQEAPHVTATTGPAEPGVPRFMYAVAAPAGQAFRPRGAAIVGTRAYFADSEGSRVAVLDLTRGQDARLAFIPIAPDQQGEKLPRRPQPTSVAALADGTLLAADAANGRLWHLAADGSLLGDFPGERERERSGLSQPVGLAVAGDEVFVTDVKDQRIKVFSVGGRFLRSFGDAGFRPGQLSFANSLAIGLDGSLFVADSNNRRVQVLDDVGAPLLVIDKVDGGNQMALPRGVALDRFGRLHVADTFGQTVYVYRDSGEPLFFYGRGPNEDEKLNMPEGIAISDKWIVVSDGGNRRVVVYSY